MMTLCPKCGHNRQANDLECPSCGIIYEKYKEKPKIQEVPNLKEKEEPNNESIMKFRNKVNIFGSSLSLVGNPVEIRF